MKGTVFTTCQRCNRGFNLANPLVELTETEHAVRIAGKCRTPRAAWKRRGANEMAGVGVVGKVGTGTPAEWISRRIKGGSGVSVRSVPGPSGAHPQNASAYRTDVHNAKRRIPGVSVLRLIRVAASRDKLHRKIAAAI